MNWQPLLPKNPAGHLPQPTVICEPWRVWCFLFEQSCSWKMMKNEDSLRTFQQKTRGQPGFVHPKDTLLKWSSWEIFPSKTTLPGSNISHQTGSWENHRLKSAKR